MEAEVARDGDNERWGIQKRVSKACLLTSEMDTNLLFGKITGCPKDCLSVAVVQNKKIDLFSATHLKSLSISSVFQGVL